MRKLLLIPVLALGLSACGALRYSVVAEKGRKGHTEVAWDVVHFHFDDFWCKVFTNRRCQ